MATNRAAPFPTAEPFLPAKITLPTLREASKGCKGCDLYKRGTQTVFGEGPKAALVMFVGEQPGDQEDKAGKPFVGPAGRILDETLDEVGIDRGEVYVTNAVKHFKWEPRGKRRIHSKPSSREVAACKPWLKAEVAVVQPRVIVPMGATAAQAIMGSAFKVTQHRGEPIEGTSWAPVVIATVHPSSILRMPDRSERQRALQQFADDLRVVRKHLDREKRKGLPKAKQAAAGVAESYHAPYAAH